jgi:hypothetical protein
MLGELETLCVGEVVASFMGSVRFDEWRNLGPQQRRRADRVGLIAPAAR